MNDQVAGDGPVSEMATVWVARPRDEEAPTVEALKCGSEEAYTWLIAQYHHPVYNLVHRLLHDPSDAEDTTQEVFLKVYRGIKRFKGDSSLKTWIYRIAIHESSNKKRWWSRHKKQETSMEIPVGRERDGGATLALGDTLADGGESPYELMAHEEVRAKVEAELRQVPEPFRTVVILRDIEGLSYEEIAETLETSLGTVKSRLVRGRESLRRRLDPFVRAASSEPGTSRLVENQKLRMPPAEVKLR